MMRLRHCYARQEKRKGKFLVLSLRSVLPPVHTVVVGKFLQPTQASDRLVIKLRWYVETTSDQAVLGALKIVLSLLYYGRRTYTDW